MPCLNGANSQRVPRSISLLLVFSLFFIVNAAHHYETYEGHKVLRIRVDNHEHARFLRGIEGLGTVELWRRPTRVGDTADLSVGPLAEDALLRSLRQNNISSTVTISNLANDLKKELHQRKRRSVFHCGLEASTIDTAAFHSLQEIECYLTAVSGEHRSTTRLIEIGRSFERRRITAIKIGTGSTKSTSALITAGIHPREWLSTATAVYIINELTQNADAYRSLLDKMDIVVIPVLNPDGYSYTWTNNRLWRKTRSGPYDDGCHGVDLNRNWGFKWGVSGDSPYPCSIIYAGPSAFSEPEAQHLAAFLRANNDTIRVFVDLHAYGELVMFPYGYTRKFPQNLDALRRTAAAATKAMNRVDGAQFKYGSVAEILYPASGSAIDFAEGELNIPYIYAMELRPGFNSPNGFLLANDQIRTGAEEAWTGITTIINRAALDTA